MRSTGMTDPETAELPVKKEEKPRPVFMMEKFAVSCLRKVSCVRAVSQ